MSLVLALSAASAAAQSGASDPMRQPSDFAVEELRKSPSIFRRAKKDTPAEQLAYAEELAQAGKARKARKAYAALVHTWHGSAEAATAQLRYARSLADKADYRDAFDEYQYLVDHFAGEFPYREVIEAQYRIANFLMTRRRFKLLGLPGVQSPSSAIPLLIRIVENAPEWERAADVQFQIGVLQEDDGSREEAIESYRAVQTRYPDSPFAAQAAFRKALCVRDLAMRRRNNEVGLRRAAQEFESFLKRYPDDEQVPLAEAHLGEVNGRIAKLYYERALYYDRAAKRKHAASMAYLELVKLFPESPEAQHARRRIDELKVELEANDDDETSN